jgi:hypothetical protein
MPDDNGKKETLMTEVFALIDDAHAHSVNEPWDENDPGIEMFRSAEQAKAYAFTWVNRQLAEAGEPHIDEVIWTETPDGVYPMNLPDDVSYFQIQRCQSTATVEEYFRQRGR